MGSEGEYVIRLSKKGGLLLGKIEQTQGLYSYLENGSTT
jgi:hypothetical protein